MKLDTLAPRALRALLTLGLAGAVSACASSGPERQVYAPPPPPPAARPYSAQPPYAAQQPYAGQQPYAAQPPAARRPDARPPVVVVPPVAQAQPKAPEARQVAIGGTAFPVDGSEGRVPPGSRLVVRVYDAAGGDVNIRAAEGAFRVSEGLPVRYKVPVAAQAMNEMELPAVAARVEGPRGGVIYRNETAVLLKSGAAGDIPMTLQRKQAASSVTTVWDALAE